MEQTQPFIPPHSMEAEKSVLGSMLISRSAVEQAVEALTAQDFYLPKHQDIFAAMAAIAAGVSLMDRGAFVIPDELSLILLLPPVVIYLISWRLSIALYKKRSL